MCIVWGHLLHIGKRTQPVCTAPCCPVGPHVEKTLVSLFWAFPAVASGFFGSYSQVRIRCSVRFLLSLQWCDSGRCRSTLQPSAVFMRFGYRRVLGSDLQMELRLDLLLVCWVEADWWGCLPVGVLQIQRHIFSWWCILWSIQVLDILTHRSINQTVFVPFIHVLHD